MFTISLFAAPLHWSNDYNASLLKAKKEHKLVYLFITSDRCQWCHKFQETTLRNKEIRKRLQKEFVLLHLSRDKQKIPAKFKTAPVPRHYFLNAEGKILYKSLGHRDVNAFNAFMDFAQDEEEILKGK
jgi:thioredoxin-related protein